jgi:signal transduction histidine kinase
MRLTLSQRLGVVFALLLLASCAASAWLQVRANTRHEEEVVQRLSRGLAAHIARNTELMDTTGPRTAAVRTLFTQLMVVNPSVEAYLLDNDGRIVDSDAPPGHLRRARVDMGPIQRLLAGQALPIMGDDPRSAAGKKVFSAAPLQVDGRRTGYVYVVLLGETRDMLAADISANSVLRATLWSMALVALLALLAGVAAFRLITRPLRHLTGAVRDFDVDAIATAPPLPAVAPPPGARDEIAILESAFGQMARRIGEQWRELTQQDRERREMVANISHDLRTPLASLHGYLETLALKADTLSESERRRYLEIALAQSRKVGRLAQELFELARLEHGFVEATLEPCSMADLLQDVSQKFELAAQAREVHLRAEFPPVLPHVMIDIGMMERILTNLLDNAIRHTPAGGEVKVELQRQAQQVLVTVSDTGPGIPAALRERIFRRPSSLGNPHAQSGGLGLLIVRRMLQLQRSEIRLVDLPGRGTAFQFELAARAS